MGLAPTEYKRDRRYFLAGAEAALLWIRNPVSEGGAKQVFRMIYAMAGPEVHKIAHRMQSDPDVKRLFRDRPDLGKALADMKSLRKLPDGSLGKTYHDFMDGEDIFPGYMLGGLAYKDGYFNRLADWGDDARFLIERIGNTHDITHVLAGYGSDFPGEALNIPFSGAALGLPAVLALSFAAGWGLASGVAIQPKIGVAKWTSVCIDAARRGVAMARQQPLMTIYLEDLLPQPLGVVQRQLGIPPHRHKELTNKDGWLVSGDWMSGWLGTRMADGFGTVESTLEKVNRGRNLVENGIPIRSLMSARAEQVAVAYEMYENGATKKEIIAALG